MSDVGPLLWLIPGLPLLACAVTALLGPGLLRKQSHWPCILAVVASCVISFLVALEVSEASRRGHSTETTEHTEGEETTSAEHDVKPPAQPCKYFTWIQIGDMERRAEETGPRVLGVDIGMTLRADALSSMMVLMVTFIGSFIAIYSVGYMSHETTGYPRFFAEISLFIAAMTTLVLADNFIVLYLGWEGVGLCSYLLIGYWFHKPSAALAARKAFLVTRIGDVGLFLGILLLWYHYGTFDFFDNGTRPGIFDANASERPDLSVIWLACLLLFCGAAGKSAQFPLHVWLPDAMEGPTPVSALIHAATMVTAGVYLLARCTPLFMLAPSAQVVVACIGGFTALLAALIALTQNDLKRVLAYSTLSQLGYMFLALGSAIREGPPTPLVTFAVTAAMFHLFTHAFFKALLFLGAGSVMHAMGDVIDMRRFGGLRRVMPTTHGTFLIGSLALAGIPPLAGFWSKDEILAAAHRAGDSDYSLIYQILFISAVVTAGLTAFYTFRAYFMTFWGELRVPPEADLPHGHHDAAHGTGHGESHASHGSHAPDHATTTAPALASAGQRSSYENPLVMTVPLLVLAVFAAGIGFAVGPFVPEGWQLTHFLSFTPGFPPLGHEAPSWFLMVFSTLIALGGIAVACWMYVRQPGLPGELAQGMQNLYQVSLNKFYIDEIYNLLIVKPLHGFTTFARVFDQYVVDGLVDLFAQVPRLLGILFRPIQNGLVQFYALAMVLGLTVFLLALIRSL
jgi:NADH-quinone oxidoreductase subunit L